MQILVTKNEATFYPYLCNTNKERQFPAGLPVECATNQPGEKYWLCPFKGMPTQWREYGRIYEPKELRPATNSEINEMSKVVLNRIFRCADESRKWPISGRFNATERAIRKIARLLPGLEGLEYFLAVEAEITRIVNQEV